MKGKAKSGQPATYTTEQAADRAGIHRITLVRWLNEKRVKASIEVPLDSTGRVLRRWTDQDVERLKKFKEKFYWHKLEEKD